MLQPTPQHFRFWRSWRWRSSLLSGVCLLVVTSASAQGYHPHPHPPPHYHGGGGGGHGGHSSMLTGPSAMPPKYYYQIDPGARKLVQRQIAPGSSGITAAATNYLLQQLEMERQQQQQHQQRSIALHQQQQLQQHQQQQTLNLLTNLTPQQIAALQTVLPTMPRSNNHGPGHVPMAGTSNAAVAVMPPGPGHPPHSHSNHHHHSYPHPTHPGPTYPPAPQQTFASRMGPFDKLINKAKAWLPDMMSAGSAHPGGPGGPSSSGDAVGEPKMRDLHRLPKPPQYPLYDLPSMGQATPPPAPIMHPMASLPNSAFDMDQPQMGSSIHQSIQSSSPRSTGGKSHGGGGGGYNSHNSHSQQNWMSPSPTMSTSRRSRPSGPPRPPKPSKSSFLRNPLRFNKKSRPSPPDREPPVNYNRRNHGPHSSGGRRDGPPGGPRSRGKYPPITTKPPKKNHGGPHRGRYPGPSRRPPPAGPPGPTSDPFGTSGSQMGFEHPMASNLSPAQSPSLGRPLSYEEYMARPSHSYTDDPWNFDPFANQMNQGLHTSALRYNYDPLGMNALDTEANSHLDPNKLSYPGDSYNRDMAKDTPSTAQIGGWDKPYKKRPYGGEPDSELTPPIGSAGFSSANSFSSSPSDPYGHTPPPSSLGSSSSRRYKNQNRHEGGPSNGGTGFLGGSLNGGRRGEMAPLDDPMEGGSDLQPYGDEPVIDDAPRIDLESLQSGGGPGDDGMEGLEFTIETTMDKDQGQDQGHDGQMEESSQPDAHPLGPMQPAATPFLSDSYSPYAEQSAPVAQTVPGSPYGPNGYQRSRDERERYGRRRTRNNDQGGGQRSSRRSSRRRSRPQPQQELVEVVELARSVPQVAPSQATQSAEEVEVPEGVQIFNEIIRPQLLEKRSSKSRHLHNNHHHHKQLRKTIYNAIRDETKK